jgi:hypothetical protein
MNIARHIHQGAQGLYRVAVVDSATGDVVWEQKEWKKNLILNQGMDAIASLTWADVFAYCAAGSGVTPTSEDSGATNASQSGTTVTAVGGSFTFVSGDVGNVIKWDSGETARITVFNSATSVTVTPSQSVASGGFVNYHTNQTSLTTELKRTNNYLTGVGNCDSSVSGSTLSMKRTFDFTAEVGTVNYTEVGLCWAASGSNTTFSRILFDAPVPVLATQQLRVIYVLSVTLSPTTPTAKTAAVSGWPVSPSTNTDGFECWQGLGMASVATTGASTSTAAAGGTCNDPSTSGSSAAIFISPDAQALATFNTTPVNRTTNSTLAVSSLASYTAFDYHRDKTGVFDVGSANRTDFRTMGIGLSNGGLSNPASATGFCFLFSQVQAKNNTQTLTLTFRYSWSRTL